MSDLQQFSEQTSLNNSAQQILQASEKFASQQAASTGDTDSQKLSASLQGALSAQSTASASMSQAKGFEQAAAQIQQSGFAGSQDAVAAIRSDLKHRDKGGASFGSSSPVWTNSDINQLFAQADAGNQNAISTLNQVVGDFSNRYASDLASGSSDVQAFYDQASSSIGGSNSVSNQDQANRQSVELNSTRVDSDLPGAESQVKSDSLSAANAVETIKTGSSNTSDIAQREIEDDGAKQEKNFQDYQEANIPGSLDPSTDWASDLKK